MCGKDGMVGCLHIIDAQRVILSVLKAAPTVSKLAEPSVIATALADSSVVLRVRWFIDDGTQTNRVASINEVIILVKEALEEANISIPFPVTTLDTNHPLLVKIENSSAIKN